jgi:hypothetical protein
MASAIWVVSCPWTSRRRANKTEKRAIFDSPMT